MGDQCRNTFLYHWHGGWRTYPQMVRDFQSVIGTEAREQIIEAEGRLPDKIVACIGGGLMPSSYFIRFWMIKTLKFLVLKRLAKASKAVCMRPPSPVDTRHFMVIAPICCKITMARLPMHIPFQPGLITPGLGLNIHGCTIPAGSIMSAPPMMKRCFRLCARRRHYPCPRTIACACLCQHHDW